MYIRNIFQNARYPYKLPSYTSYIQELNIYKRMHNLPLKKVHFSKDIDDKKDDVDDDKDDKDDKEEKEEKKEKDDKSCDILSSFTNKIINTIYIPFRAFSALKILFKSLRTYNKLFICATCAATTIMFLTF